MISSTEFFAAFVISMLLAGAFTPLMIRVANWFHIYDHPNESHKAHTISVPYLGGIAILIAVSSVTITGTLLITSGLGYTQLAISILGPSILLAIVGLVDDIRKLSPKSRFFMQSLVGLFTALLLIKTNTVGSPIGLVQLDFLITILWVVGVANAVNFLDNLDGSAAGTVAISALGLTVLTVSNGQYLLGALSIVLSGSLLGFLYWNRRPARIYMGDAGALFIGTLIAGLLVRFDPNPISRLSSFSIPILLMAIPILDSAVAISSRFRRGISPFKGGYDHLSHRLLRRGFSKELGAYTLWSLTLAFALLAILVSNVPYEFETPLSMFGLIFWIFLYVKFMQEPDE